MTTIRHDWQIEEIMALYEMPFNDIIYEAQKIHRVNFDANEIQISTLLSIKTGGCAEDCKYCPQSSHYNTGVQASKLLDTEIIAAEASKAKAAGASRFCMGAAWRSLKDRDLPKLENTIKQVKAQGLETCMTLGMLTAKQAHRLRAAGLDYYNHNLDSSPEFYGKIITTRTYEERLKTLEAVRQSGLKTCCGGIIGMGESRKDRAALLMQLANLPQHPESVPINMLVKVKGTDLQDVEDIDYFEFIRTIAIARIMMPKSVVRLSAGRENMPDTMQALCFLAGANSIFYGEKLLTTRNPEIDKDKQLLARLGLHSTKIDNLDNHKTTSNQAA